MQNYPENIQDLSKCTVGIKKNAGGDTLGAGVIVTDEGLIVTCYHVVGSIETETITHKKVDIFFPSARDIRGHASAVENHCDPKLDIAFFLLQEKLPEQSVIAKLDETVDPKEHNFQSFGFRNPEGTIKFDSLPANGVIQAKTRLKSRDGITESPPLITLKSDQIAKGMSGAPVLDTAKNRVVGIISDHYEARYLTEDADIYRTLSLAIPIESIIKVYPLITRDNPGLSEDLRISNLSPVFEASKYALDEIERLLNSERYHQILSKRIGLRDLIAVGSRLCQEIRKGNSEEEAAFRSLIAYTFDSAKESIDGRFRDLDNNERSAYRLIPADDLNKNYEQNVEKIWSLFLNPFKQHDIYNGSYLPDYSSICNFKKNIVSYLKKLDISIEVINYFLFRFNLLLSSRASADVHIRKFYKWWTNKQKVQELVKYLEETRTDQTFIQDVDKIMLEDYHVVNRAFMTSFLTWEKTDMELEKNSKYLNENEICDSIRLLEGFLEQNEEWYRFIGGEYGIGKSSLCRRFVSLLAKDYLQNSEVEKENEVREKKFIPVYCPLIKDIKIKGVWGQKTIEDLLKLIFPAADPYCKCRKVLLILDGLNEYPTPENLMADINHCIGNYRDPNEDNIKVIITTRVGKDTKSIKDSISQIESSRNTEYIRLLPFSQPQVDEFFEKYKVKKSISYDHATRVLNWNESEIRKPLFAWMMALIYTGQRQIITPKKSDQQIQHISNTLIYFDFIHKVILQEENRKEPRISKRKIMRSVAALKHVYKDALVHAEPEEQLEDKVNLSSEIQKFYEPADPATFNSLYKPYLSKPTIGDSTVNFVHPTLGEYLLSEYFIEMLLEGKNLDLLNIVIPSSETLRFLDGLIYLMNEQTTKDNIVQEFEIENSDLDGDARLKRITDNAVSCIKDTAIFSRQGISAINMILSLVNRNYELAYMKRWISLFILNRLIAHEPLRKDQEKNMSTIKEKVVELIVSSSKLHVPTRLKTFNNFDLSDVNLIETNLAGADFSDNKNLICTNFFYAKLTSAQFPSTDLLLANFWRANLKNINFYDARLFGANLYLAEMRGSDLRLAKLGYAEIYGANLARSNLSNADLSNANLSNADLSHVNLSNADLSNANLARSNLSNADLSHANLSNADLSNANLSGANMDVKDYSNLKCENANLHDIKTKDQKLYGYLIEGSKKSGWLKPGSKESSESNVSLTGKWRSNDGGTYYVNKIGNTVWFLGVSNALNFVSVFKGNLTDNGVIKGQWTDVPLGEDMDYGHLNLQIKVNAEEAFMVKVYETGGYGATIWMPVKNLPLKNEYKLYDKLIPLYINNENDVDLTGIWKLTNGNRTDYVHRVGNVVWSLGIDTKDNFAGVFRGEFIEEDIIDGEWADVDRKDNGELRQRKLRFKINKSGQKAVSFRYEEDDPQLEFYRFS